MILDVTLRSLVDKYHRFGQTVCLSRLGGNREVTFILNMEAVGLSEMLVPIDMTSHTSRRQWRFSSYCLRHFCGIWMQTEPLFSP
jgi:hypothetical protein